MGNSSKKTLMLCAGLVLLGGAVILTTDTWGSNGGGYSNMETVTILKTDLANPIQGIEKVIFSKRDSAGNWETENTVTMELDEDKVKIIGAFVANTGANNRVNGVGAEFSSVLGGTKNEITRARESTIGGGSGNKIDRGLQSFIAGGGIYYYNSAADSTIDFYPREPYTNKNIIFQLPTIDSVSYGGGMIKDWFNTSDGLGMRSTGYPNSYQTIYCSHTSKTSTKGGKRLCGVDYFTLNAEATNRGLIPDGDNVITLEIGGPSPNPNPGYNAPYGLQVNIDAGG